MATVRVNATLEYDDLEVDDTHISEALDKLGVKIKDWQQAEE